MKLRVSWAKALSLALLQLSCGKGPEVILRSAAGAAVSAADIDRDPLQLLPPGSIAWFHLDVTSSAQSDLGQYVLSDLEARFPMPDQAGFSLRRDVTQLNLAAYSLQGVDFAGVALGSFDAAKIAAAAVEYKGGPLAPQLTKSEYAGRTLFTAQNVGFSILTAHTALFGNDVGMRRCLDRIADARVADDLPAWVKELLGTPNASFSFGGDLSGNAVTATLPRRLALLEGASQLRVVGNFTPPGVNLAGTIQHANPTAAGHSATALREVGGSVNVYAQLLGLGRPIRKLETQAVGNDAQLVIAVEGDAIKLLMKRFLPPPPPLVQHSGPGWADQTPADREAVARVTP
ncbi:MAG TPA: hypothetical protein VFS67_25315 [Polyangiaceae bacterium]|nr:hypothetical protein [Polyangiaceae bacterium]